MHASSSENPYLLRWYLRYFSLLEDRRVLIRPDPSHARTLSYSGRFGNRQAVTSLSQTGEMSLMWSDCSLCRHFSFTRRRWCGSSDIGRIICSIPQPRSRFCNANWQQRREESTKNTGLCTNRTGHLHWGDICKPHKYSYEMEKGLRVGCEFVFQMQLTSVGPCRRACFFASVAKSCKIH